MYRLRQRGYMPKAEYTKAAIRSYLSTLMYASIVDKRESSQEFQDKRSMILESI